MCVLEIIGRAILLVICLIFVTIYVAIAIAVETINWPFDKLEDKAELYISSVFNRKRGYE